MLELKNVSKTYEGKPLLRDISFTVEKGETICLLGASGSGKSTILRIIAGLENPERGQVLFNGMDLAQTPPHLRDFGLVFQDYGLFPHLDVFENVAFGLRMRRRRSPTSNALENAFYAKDEIHRRVHEMLELVNLQGFERRKVTDLSGGEQQRVALARALAPNPRLLMFDEPLGALDRSLKDDLLDELRRILHRTGIPAIYVTHDQEEAFAIADRILVLHDGTITRDAAPQEIWRDPQYAVVAKLLGIGNVIEGKVIAKNKVKTAFGIFNLHCAKNLGEKIQLLMTEFPSPSGRGARGEGKPPSPSGRGARGEGKPPSPSGRGARGEGKPPSPLGEGRGGEVIAEIQLAVEDVLFKRDQFEVRGRGGLTFHMKDAPKAGEVIAVEVRVQCLK